MNHLKMFRIILLAAMTLAAGVADAAMNYISPTRYDWSQVSQQIIGNRTDKRRQAYAIYRWLCDNIAYDTSYTIHDSDNCFDLRKGVCQAYCELFYRIAEPAGLKVDIISGSSKDIYGKVEVDNHAWLFVYTDDTHGMLIDPTWGAGSVSDGVFTRSDNDDSWFDVDPHWMIFSHHPSEQVYQLLDNPISLQTFSSLPPYRPFLGRFGFNASEIYHSAMGGSAPDLPEFHEPMGDKWQTASLPLDGTLRVGTPYDFAYKAEPGLEFSVINESRLISRWQQNGEYTVCRVVPSKGGKLSFGVRRAGEDGFKTIAIYKVAQPTDADIRRLEQADPLSSPVFDGLANFHHSILQKRGVDFGRLLSTVRSEGIKELAMVYGKGEFRINSIPWNKKLHAGSSYTISLLPAGSATDDYAVIVDGEWSHNWTRGADGSITMQVSPARRGPLKVLCRIEGEGDSYWSLIEYDVE